ncbi:c-type cytochrome [Halodurantibacterium flavum]|uniref:C-type cytochrome n=1 Tax=Halodurantibacterium flavum TaxID=1382802 RepID=A0ABW4S9R1_9RHOB
MAFTALLLVAVSVVLPGGTGTAAFAQDLRGHGGPVSALVVEGGKALSGSFDTRVLLWDIGSGTARRALRLHEGNVTAVAFLPDGRLVSGGQDGRVVVWGADGAPERVETLHEAPVAALSVAAESVASAGWDGRIFVMDGDDAPRQQGGHDGQVTGLARLPDGRLVSVGADLRLVVWDGGAPAASIGLPAQPNDLAMAGDVAAVVFADGALRLVSPLDGVLRERFLADRPLIAVAAAEGRLAVAAIEGTVWVLDAEGQDPPLSIAPGQGPVWSLALAGGELFTGGGDGIVRRWDATTGDPLSVAAPDDPRVAQLTADGSRGAEVWRACAVCHSLGPDDGNRAGPTLHRIFGRRIATLPGYEFSPALRGMDIVWTPETVSELFEHGPDAYTPGSRMPDQRITDAGDRAALMEFLARASE